MEIQVREKLKAMNPKAIAAEKDQSVCSNWANESIQLQKQFSLDQY